VELKNTSAGGAPGLLLAADQVALELKNPLLGSTGFRNATGNGENRWITELDYAGLVNARSQGLALQSQFSAINTDSSNLSAFAAAKGKLLMYHGLDDEYIPIQGSIHYYQKVVESRMLSVSIDFILSPVSLIVDVPKERLSFQFRNRRPDATKCSLHSRLGWSMTRHHKISRCNRVTPV
jgi:hypothetical protein